MNWKILVSLATLGPIGYLPASGTIATVATLPIIALFHFFKISLPVSAIIFCIIFVLAFFCVRSALAQFKEHDPSAIVLDEVVGCLITFYAVPLNYTSIVVGIVLFRLFDITKIFGIKRLEHFDGTWGIMLDDIAAGFMTNIILHILRLLHVI
jgi:phosphatidylglycerophosphatase A